MKTLNVFLIILLASAVMACGGAPNNQAEENATATVELADPPQFETTETGLEYYFFEKTDGRKPELNEILSVYMVYRIQDSIIFDSQQMGMPMFLPMMASEYPGDIYEGFAMMAVGDSVIFRTDAASFYVHTAGMPEAPDYVKPGDQMIFDIRLLSVMNEDEFAQEQQRLMEEQMAADMQRADDEEGLMLEYLRQEGITVSPTESGLYYVELQAGDGPQPDPGNMVAVHYEGRLLDGTVFDSSYDRNQPLEFRLGQRQVIPGWDEGISYMRVGGKARLIIPSYLAYGERGAGGVIPPFSTLVFDVELVDIVD